MTHDETVKLIGLLVVAYPSYDKFGDEKHLSSTVALWETMFADDNFRLVQLALEKHIATSKWPPSIADIRDIMADITMPNLLPADKAWMAVQKLMSMHDRLYYPTDHYLPAPIAQAVDTVGFDQLKAMSRAGSVGHDSKAGLASVAFRQAYEAIRARTREQAALPGALRARLDSAHKYYADGSEERMLRLDAEYQEHNDYYNQSVFGALGDGTTDPHALPESQ